MGFTRKCWICGRTNKEIHDEIKEFPKKTSMMTTVRGINAIQFYICVPCKSMLRTVSSRTTIQHIIRISNDIAFFNTHMKEFNDHMDELEKQVHVLNKFFISGEKRTDELKDVT